MINILSFMVLAAALGLFILKVWHWYDTHEDWVIARVKPEPISETARGMMRLAWLRLIDGVFWLSIGILSWLNRSYTAVPLNTRLAGRVNTLVLIGMEAAKILTERLTRANVLQAAEVAAELLAREESK